MDVARDSADDRPVIDGSAEPVLEVVDLSAQMVGPPRGVTRRRHVEAVLRSLSLSLRPGERLGLAGGQGSGKTLIGRVVAGAVAPDSGGVALAGQDIVGLRPRALRRACRAVHVIAPIPIPGVAGRQRTDVGVERMFAQVHGDRSTDAVEAALRQLVRLGVTGGSGRRRIRRLDDEQLIALCVARAAVLSPAVVVLDGISACVSADVLAGTLDVLERMRTECGTAMLVLDRDVDVVAEASDAVGVLHGGRVVEFADPASLRQAPLHPLTVEVLTGSTALPTWSGDSEGCGFRQHCVRAKDRCRTEVPQLERPLGEGHPVACHFAGEHRAFGAVRLPPAPGDLGVGPVGAGEPTAREFALG